MMQKHRSAQTKALAAALAFLRFMDVRKKKPLEVQVIAENKLHD